jgi:hypothetical protein
MSDKTSKEVGARMKTVMQSDLSSECLIVQMFGTISCASCEYKNRGCGGKQIRETGKNSKGLDIGPNGL